MRKLFLSAGHNLNKRGAKKLIDETNEAIRLRNSIMLCLSDCQCMTDCDDMSLTKTIQAVNKFCGKGDIAVELHFNSSGDIAATGAEVVVSNNAMDLSRSTATILVNAVSSALGIRNRGVKTESQSQYKKLAFVSDTKCAAVILEICFISNSHDVEKYNTNFATLVKALADSLKKILS